MTRRCCWRHGPAEAYTARLAKSSDNRYPEAIADYDKAIDLDKACGSLGQQRSALAESPESDAGGVEPRHCPAGAAATSSDGRAVSSNKKNFTAAISDFDEAIRLRPEEAPLFVARAILCECAQYEPSVDRRQQGTEAEAGRPDILTVRATSTRCSAGTRRRKTTCRSPCV